MCGCGIETASGAKGDGTVKRSMPKKPIKKRIEDALTGSGGKLEYHALLYQVFPREEYPRAYRNSSNGGPPGCAMALGRALREMFNDHRIDDSLHDFGRTIRLRQFRSG